jgi:iron complex outermembrane receptor protein
MKFKFYLSSLTFVLATFFMVNAQTNTVTGKVSDGASSLFGINVMIQGTTDNVVTDENGIFTLSSDQALPWNLEFTSLGFATQTLSVVSTSQLISITLQAGEELDEVTITGLRKPEKVSETITSISSVLLSEIENRPTFNAATLLDNIVGVQVDNQGPNRTNVTLRDNVDVFSTSTLVMLDYRDISQVGLSFFDPGNSNLNMIDLERVEIIRGPQAALYGPGVDAGVVHYLSKDPFKYAGTTLQIQTGGIQNGGSMFSGNNLMKSVYFRHAVSNKDQTLGYKFNLRHSETPEWDLNSSQSTSIFGATGTRNIVDPLNGAQVGTVSNMRDGSTTGADATLYYRPSNNFSFTTVAGIGNTVGNAWTSGTGEVFANTTQGFLQFRMNTKNLFVQYNYTANVNGKTGDKIGFNYRTGGVSYIDSKQSQLQVQYEIPFEKLNTDVSIGFEHKFAQFESYKRTFGRNEDFTNYRLYGAYASSKTKLGDKFILSLAGRYDS